MNEAPLKKVEPVKEEEKLRIEDVPDIIKGNQRLKGENDKDYKERQKNEKYLLRLRLKFGVSQFRDNSPKGSPKQPFTNHEKRIEKSMREQKKVTRKARALARRIERKQQ